MGMSSIPRAVGGVAAQDTPVERVTDQPTRRPPNQADSFRNAAAPAPRSDIGPIAGRDVALEAVNELWSQVGRIAEVLGVLFIDISIPEAILRLEALIRGEPRRTRSVFFVNAHTLNLAVEDPSFLASLNTGDLVFGDGTGVRWAARLRGRRLVDNVNGTDLVPAFLRATGGHGYRYYMLGGETDTVERAAEEAQKLFGGWELVGHRNGFIGPGGSDGVVAKINETRPDVLLVGMGEPLQERWILANQDTLSVPMCVAVGGLFDHWGGNLRRAAPWVRRLGFEWLQLLFQQPHKFARYMLGNPKFLIRAVRSAASARKSLRGVPSPIPPPHAPSERL